MASLILADAVWLTSCQKKNAENETLPLNLISEAKVHFERNDKQLGPAFTGKSNAHELSNPRKYSRHWPRWQEAIVTEFMQGQAVMVPIEYSKPFLLTTTLSKNYSYPINAISKLLVYRDKKGILQSQVITYLPDSVFLKSGRNSFSGIIVVEDCDGILINMYLAHKDGTIKKARAIADKASSEVLLRIGESAAPVCLYTQGYNYSADDPEGVYWSELIGCSTYYPESPGPGPQPSGFDYSAVGSGGVGPSPVYTNFVVYSPTNPIGNIKDYFKCFINKPGSDYQYQIALCVSQPEPGYRTAWETINPFSNDNNPIYVGHTYLIITQVTPAQTIIRNVGFYPLNGVSPYSPSDQGVLNNDQNGSYDIKLTIRMTSSQFFTVLNYINQANSSIFQYNLNTNNCTTFAINALNSAGFGIPATRGTWHNGQGCNPGDLGEDIRSLPLTENMSRTTTYGTHLNKGSCLPIE
ncbi:hypothetical protein D3H65_28245 [Paraflavitalea soli]|uniref:Uncharacterized protein n=1 Tax=Paraflavitalea soli TaxID=2315862 RepID=A0A3B7N0T1_9BACT|nr:hypothetical protein D3H65_28245 [Paraflavitalea soli]